MSDIQPVLNLARNLTMQAAAAVVGLCHSDRARFWRSTAHRKTAQSQEDAPIGRFPTVSLCCSQALLALRLAQPQWVTDDVDSVISQAAQRIPVDLGFDDLSTSSLTTGSDPSPFTVAQQVQALALLGKEGLHVDKLNTLIADILEHRSQPFGKRDSGPHAHPFVMYHVLRAIEEAAAVLGEGAVGLREQSSEIYSMLETEATRLLAYHHVGRVSPAQVVALAFCGAGLAYEPTGTHDQYAFAALRAACAGQEKSGCWALGRVVREDKDIASDGMEIEISTYDIVWAIADATLLLQTRRRGAILANSLDLIIDSLILGAKYAETSLITLAVDVKPDKGWCSDHAYNSPMIESWTSATVLRAGLSLERLLREIESNQTITRYVVTDPDESYWPRWLRWPSFRTEGEVDQSARILTYLDDYLVQPIRRSPLQLPSGDSNTVSAVFFGPPGTSKTTVARGIADGLGWPMVELNPGVFIERGLELIEARSREVFEDLHRMQRVLVLFDECDELFRARGPSASSEQMRSITAFVTASMLPKLQRLHDDGNVVFVICTNNFAHLDPAIKRRGRIDHIVGVGPPDESARRRIVENELEQLGQALVMPRLWTATERFSRAELIQLARRFNNQAAVEARSSDQSIGHLAETLISSFEPSLNISSNSYTEFKEQCRTSSHPHLYRSGVN